MVAADDDRRFDSACAHELVEAQSGSRALAVANPADARGQPLEVDPLAGRLDPAHQGVVIRELLDHRAVGYGDVVRIARQSHPAERTLAFAEERTDVGGNESLKVECSSAPAQLRFRPQAVAVVEHLRAAVEERDHGVDVAGHTLAGSAHVTIRVVEAQLLCVLGADTRGDVAERIVRRGLVGDYVDVEAACNQRGQHIGGVAMQRDRKRPLRLPRLAGETQRVVEVGCAHVDIAVVEPALDSLGVGLDADRHTTVERDCQRLRAAHAAEPCGQGDRSRERTAEALARHRGECLVRALEDALRADVDPRPRRHLAVHGQPERLQAPELIPRRPLRHQQRIGNQHAGSPLVGVEHANWFARLDQQRLVALQSSQLADDRVEGLPRPRRLAGASVDDEVLRTLGDLGIEIVHQHPHRGLLWPPEAGELGAARRADHARQAHFSGPVTA